MRIDWVWLFLDTPAAQARASWDFWAAASGQRVAEVRGDQEQFATLAPGHGAPWVKLQAVGDGGGLHLDLDAADIGAATEHAIGCGATLERHYDDVAVMRSPCGFTFCLTSDAPSGAQFRDREVLLDQACLDVPAERYDAELAFWQQLTGWQTEGFARGEFAALRRPDGIPVRLLLQRLDDAPADQPVTAHPDLATRDREAATAAHVALGAEVVQVCDWWTVMRDPVGRAYCLTQRDPVTGLSPGRPTED